MRLVGLRSSGTADGRLIDAPDPGAAPQVDRSRAAAPSSVPVAAERGFLAAFWFFVLIGLAIRLPDTPLRSCLAAAGAMVCALILATMRSNLRIVPAVAAAAGVAVLGNAMASNVGWFGVCVLACWCALTAPRRHAIAFAVAAVLLFTAQAAWAQHDPGWVAWTMGTALAALAGFLVQHNRQLVVQLRAAQLRLAERARTEERQRIARELHDLLGHSLTVVLLQVASARMALKYDAADAEPALLEAERLGRATLDEVRATVGLMRSDAPDASSAMQPLPSLADVEVLARTVAAAGLQISCETHGDLAGAPQTVGLAAYRIVQEALTNGAKHAAGGAIDVRVLVRPAVIELEVSNTVPAGVRRRDEPPGVGLSTMQERAEAVGGTVTAGSRGGRWRVRAELPLPARQGRVEAR
jgi:signal transduction histidine kinase